MKRLTEIGDRFQTDKASFHGFTEFYNDYFEKFDSPRILEIGIFDGGSLRMYDEFWEDRAKIIGVDISTRVSNFSDSKNIKAVIGDIMSSDTIQKIKVANNNELFDIIIDDAGHMMDQQQYALKNLWPLLKPNGIFVMEDLHTSLMQSYNPDNAITTLTVLGNIRNKTILPTKYLTHQDLEKIVNETEEAIIRENGFPQDGNIGPRISITSIIVKKGPKSQEKKASISTIPGKITPSVQADLNETDNFTKPVKVFDRPEPEEESEQGTRSDTNEMILTAINTVGEMIQGLKKEFSELRNELRRNQGQPHKYNKK
jgi:SAM-dependent methyltransferase